MFTPMFDGQYRSRPKVSLIGASKQGELSCSLLSKARMQREERERDRVRTSSAITLQRVYRGYRVRCNVHRQLRAVYDSGCGSCSSPARLYSLTSQLLIFYRINEDQKRLVTLCQKWVQYRVGVQRDIGVQGGPPFRLLCRLLTLSLRSLSHTPQQGLSGPLRAIDVYTNGNGRGYDIIDHVLKNGYYAMLRTLIETRIPPPDEDTPLLPLATSLLEYMVRPIKSNSENSYQFILMELLAPPLSPHVCHLIIPALKRCGLDLSHLLSLVGSGPLLTTPTSTVCYCILSLTEGSIDSLSVQSVGHLLTLISNTLKMDSGMRKKGAELLDEEAELLEEEEGEEDMDQDPTSGGTALSHCIINQAMNNDTLIQSILKYSDDLEVLLDPLCSLCYHVLSKREGSASMMFRYKLLRSLALSHSILSGTWRSLVNMTLKRTFGPSVNALTHFSRSSSLPTPTSHTLFHRLATFAVLLYISLSSLHDIEMFTMGPFTMIELSKISLVLRDAFVNLNMNMLHPLRSRPLDEDSGVPQLYELQFLSIVLYRVLKSLYDRNSRLGFCTVDSWACLSIPSTATVDLFMETDGDDDEPRPQHPAAVYKQANLLKRTPFVFHFIHRVAFFHKLVATSRYNSQGRLQEFLLGPSVSISARRTHLYEDAFAKLATRDLRQRLKVQLINEQGLDEAGIDGGGLFREFLSETLKTGFDPNRGFFATTKDGFLYPSSTVHLVNKDHALHYRFLGSLLGKALLEQMMVELPFAPFFLRKLTTGGRGWVDAHYLGSLDPELYRHLLWLKNYEGDFEELGLDFTTSSNEFGQSRVVELKAGGGTIRVTAANCIEYIHSLADYHLNKTIDAQFRAFREGLNSVIPVQWLSFFNQIELQTLISGAEEPINMADLKKYTTYSGSYNGEHKCIEMFWDIVSEFSELQKRQLLKFVTSCSRPPLLGFKELHPPFAILSARETDHLPSASTCMHLLKLPMFETKEEMREKLMYAIASGAGFELS